MASSSVAHKVSPAAILWPVSFIVIIDRYNWNPGQFLGNVCVPMSAKQTGKDGKDPTHVVNLD